MRHTIFFLAIAIVELYSCKKSEPSVRSTNDQFFGAWTSITDTHFAKSDTFVFYSDLSCHNSVFSYARFSTSADSLRLYYSSVPQPNIYGYTIEHDTLTLKNFDYNIVGDKADHKYIKL